MDMAYVTGKLGRHSLRERFYPNFYNTSYVVRIFKNYPFLKGVIYKGSTQATWINFFKNYGFMLKTLLLFCLFLKY